MNVVVVAMGCVGGCGCVGLDCNNGLWSWLCWWWFDFFFFFPCRELWPHEGCGWVKDFLGDISYFIIF